MPMNEIHLSSSCTLTPFPISPDPISPDVSAYEAKKLCEQIFDAVGVPGPMRTFYFQTMNIWLHKKHLPTCP